MDYEFWGKLLLAGARFQYTEIPFGIFREHANQKTHDMLTTDPLFDRNGCEIGSASGNFL